MKAALSSAKTHKTKLRIDQLKNFGFVDEVTVVAPGINGKMRSSTPRSALLQLQHVDEALRLRTDDAQYRQALADIPGIECLPPVRQ